MFSETYRPKKIAEIVGQPAAVKEFLAWYNTWPEQGKACLLSGKPGVGKTSLVEAVKEEMRLDLIELNTSDKRNAEAIERIVGNAASSQTLFGGRKLILLDEVDNMSGREDMGGTKAIAKIISETKNPMVLIANDFYEVPEGIRYACRHIQFRGIHESTILKRLGEIAIKENLKVSSQLMEDIARNAGGDLRAALNDLESLSEGTRDLRPTMFSALSSLFRAKSAEVRKEFWNLDEKPENVMMWVAENLPYVYEKRDIAEAYDNISRADIFLRRVSRRQCYGLWRYASDLMTAGVSVARDGKFTFHKFSMPSFILHMSRTKKKRGLEKSLREKIGQKCHCSAYAARTYLPMLQALDMNPEKLASLALYLELDEDELSLVSKKPEEIMKFMRGKEREEAKMRNGEEGRGKQEKMETRKKRKREEKKDEEETKGLEGETGKKKRTGGENEGASPKKQKTLFDYK